MELGTKTKGTCSLLPVNGNWDKGTKKIADIFKKSYRPVSVNKLHACISLSKLKMNT